MAARVFLLSILFTEVLRPACLAGVKGASGGVGGLNVSKFENLELGIRLDTEPSGNVLVERKGAVLRCSGGNGQNVSWFRNGEAAPPCGLLQCNATANGVLRLKMAPRRGNRGNKNSANDKILNPESYRCVAKNNVGSVRSRPALVQIPYLAHEFSKSPQDVSVREGELARLFCSIVSVPSPANITWQHDGQPLSFIDKTKYFMVSPGVLYINATRPSDAGSYRCVASNKFSTRRIKKSKEAKLRVESKFVREKLDVPKLFPQILYDYRLIIGSNLTLVCASSGFPSLVIWTFISQPEDDAAFEQPRLLFNSTNSIAVLKLTNLTVADAGSYQCSVEKFGKTLQTQSVTVDVLVPPTFVIKPKGDRYPSGKSIRFECQVHGRPMPRIYWLKDSENLEMNPRRGTYMKGNGKMDLAISSTIPEDSGIYQCVAVNDAGEIWSAGRLQITYSPRSPPVPTSLNCRAVSSDRISLSWVPPVQTPPSLNVSSFITVHYAIVEPGSREDIFLPDQNSSPVEVPLLEPFTNYTVYVRVWNKDGASNQSTRVQCSTAESGTGTNDGRLTLWNKFVPTAVPVVNANAISSTKLKVSWLPLNRKEARGYIVEYKLQWRPKDHPSFRVRNIPAALNQYIVTDLIPGMHYDVRVLARTKQGWSNISDSQLNWTKVVMPLTDSSESPLAELVDLDVINVDESTIKVEWKFKEETSEQKRNLDTWKLYYQNEAGKKLLTTFPPKNCTEYLFTELEVTSSYGIGLCMIRSGESEVCLLRQLHSKKSIDDHVLTDLEGIPISSTSINITWAPVSSSTEHRYEVCYKPVDSSDSVPPVCLNTTNESITVQALKPYTLYQFKVTALYNTGEPGSPHSQTIECYTDEDGEELNKLLTIQEKSIFREVPGAVREVIWFRPNSTVIRIAWKQPDRLNGVIRNYTVSYIRSPLSKQTEHWANVTVPGIVTTANLSGLAHGTRYYVEVRAATNAGYGQPSERISIHTNDAHKNFSNTVGTKTPSKPATDQSLGIIVGVSISTCCIIICLASIYCRKKWENTQSPRESSQSLKDRVILRNGNGCCVERNSVSISQHVPTSAVMNEIELAVLCQPSPKTKNPHDGRSNGVVESCVKEPLLTPWDINGDSKDLNITENPQCKPRSSTGSNRCPEQGLDDTQLTTLNYTVTSSGSSLNNNFERSESLSSVQQAPSTSVPVIAPNG